MQVVLRWQQDDTVRSWQQSMLDNAMPQNMLLSLCSLRLLASNHAFAGRQTGPDTQINGQTQSGQTDKRADRVVRHVEMDKQILAQVSGTPLHGHRHSAQPAA